MRFCEACWESGIPHNRLRSIKAEPGIGNKEDAQYIGGFNIFGEKYGDYPQNIIMNLEYMGTFPPTGPMA